MARISGFNHLIDERLRQICLIPEFLPGRVIEVRSQSLRKCLRGFSSGREEVTTADRLFVGLAYLDPLRILENHKSAGITPLQLSRMKRTWADGNQRQNWAVVMATRLLCAVESAAVASGMSVEWISEGLDFAKINELLAVPDDHVVIGFLAVSGGVVGEESEDYKSPLLDYDGFFGA